MNLKPKHALAIYAGSDPNKFYPSVIADLGMKERQSGNSLHFLDLSGVVGGTGADAASHQIINLGVDSIIFDTAEEVDLIHGSLMSPNLQSALDSSIKSALITYARDDKPPQNSKYKKMAKRLYDEALGAASLFKFYTESLDIGRVYIPNGRFPYQRAIATLAKDAGIETLFFERGERDETHYYLSRHSPIERLPVQDELKQFLLNSPNLEEINEAELWFTNRIAGHGHHFSRGWQDSKEKKHPSSRKKVTIFTSSQDEFEELGDDWKIHTWASQWEAFHIVSRYMLNGGFEIELRVHPNLASKSHKAFARTMQEIKSYKDEFPNARIIGHDSVVNSYELISESDAVIVWSSTVGLEAVRMGKPTYALTATYYDEIVDIRQWLGNESYPEINKFIYETNTDSALRYKIAAFRRDVSIDGLILEFRDRIIANFISTKLLARIGVSRFFVFPALWIDLLRNRSLSTNIRILINNIQK
jgi:hypothetical protein